MLLLLFYLLLLLLLLLLFVFPVLKETKLNDNDFK